MAGDSNDLTGKIALVTGAAKRLGKAIALALGRAGANVVIHYHQSAVEAEALAEDLRSAGVDAWTISADLSCPEQAGDLLPRAVELAGPIDILVNNASIFPAGGIMQCQPEEIDRNIHIHATAPLLICRALAAQKRVGHIVNLLDSRITDYDRDHAAYHLSKRMLADITRMLAVELAPEIAVNAVAPGLILPPAGKDESYLRDLAHTNPLNRYGSADEITRAVMYLVTSSFVTGQVLFVDGGRHMRGRMYD